MSQPDLEAENRRISAGELEAVEKWLADPNVGLHPLARAALDSLCKQIRWYRENVTVAVTSGESTLQPGYFLEGE